MSSETAFLATTRQAEHSGVGTTTQRRAEMDAATSEGSVAEAATSEGAGMDSGVS